MKSILDEIDSQQQELKEFYPLSQDQQKKLDEKFRLEFNYNSNHIEGNTLTYGETKLLLIFDETKGNHALREYEEMKAHDVAFQMVKELAADNERPLTEQFIKHLNEVLLVRPFWKDAITNDGQSTRRLIKIGDYKEHTNSVRLPNGEMFEYSSPLETPIQMRELVEWYNNEKDATHVVTLAAMLHYKFVRIHPFDDGNGRISRLLVNYVLLKNDFPPLVIKSEDKANYLRALHLADAGDYEAFISYIGEQLLWSLQISIKAAKNENIEEDEDWKKKLHLLKTKTSDVKNVELSKSSVNFEKLFGEYIFPFLLKVKDSIIEFDDLFLEKQISFHDGTHNWVTISKQTKLIQQAINSSRNNSLRINLTLLDFKKSHEKRVHVSVEILFSFEHLSYSLKISDTEVLRKLYHEKFTDEEINLIKNKIAAIVVSTIEEKLKTLKG